MALTGAHIKTALASVGAVGGQVVTFDRLAAGANEAMKMMGVRTLNQAAAFLATMAQESAYFRTTREYGTGQRYAPYIGRTFEQVTWQSNYRAFGSWAKSKGLVTDGNVFVNNPSALGDMRWAWLGGVWYWTIPRTTWGTYKNLMQVADTGSILLVSRAVNRGTPLSTGTPYGMTERTRMFNAFKALGSSIVPTAASAPKPPVTSPTTQPSGTILGTPGQIVASANALWTKYKGKYYGTAWPGLAELGRQPEYWCADFVRLAIRKGTGYDWAKYCSSPAYTPALVAWMKKDDLWDQVSYAAAKPGDVIFYLRSNGTPYHVGIVEFSQTTGHNLRTIEGNTSTPGISESMSNGGTVAKKTRDDRTYSTIIFRGTFWTPPTPAPTPENPTPTPDDPVDPEQPNPTPPDPTPENPDPEPPEPSWPDPPILNLIDRPFGDLVRTMPVADLTVSPAFLAAHVESHEVASRVDAWLGDQPVWPNLPLLQDESSVRVDLDSNVRRTASLTFQADYDSDGRDLARVLMQPGVELRVTTGVRHGNGASELVPVHTGRCMTPSASWPEGRIRVESPDLMVMVAQNGFTRPVVSNPACTYVDAIAYLIEECDPQAQIVDLTGNDETIPEVVWADDLTSRINAVTALAAAIGARVYASPVPHVYVIRPITTPGAPALWEFAHKETLIDVDTKVDWSKVYNAWRVVTERADQAAVQGVYEDTNPASATRVDGPFGVNRNTMRTSLLTSREQCEAAAKALCDRSVGNRLDVAFTGLRNPLLEADDPITVITDTDAYDLVLGSFTVPLGNQGVIDAQARSFDISALTSLTGGA
ncbi:DUF5047 domain-containing protein [Luteipulveratus halotolerans]|uniref:DUF5047 domain-containing protein n=1 Tax=Luteipulveratus halotolerans TaxID=1631356 RepID=A0A0L6CK47_9MICO|nr:DUF5047 domain-containing protein [Luteipulveratus halotolerans]KNX38109.1 hypothetical protein VV01_14695 [Luteipulveratus halotolerans]